MRGNHEVGLIKQNIVGSIPADAGEPPSRGSGGLSSWVYPRGCGGTSYWRACAPLIGGLSPRMRGNRGQTGSDAISAGSIPADAGEPLYAKSDAENFRVYPRGCGGTPDKALTAAAEAGLSPRMRGNLGPETRRGKLQGSIPADAGEPIRHSSSTCIAGVYPRGCGGTSVS